jgi:enoyl-[acyl-carrier protein] reductase II
VLIPAVREKVNIPVIAAGGIATGRQMFAAMALGADGVQVGSRFVASLEASCHQNFKEAIISSVEGDTQLSLKALTPVRLLKNEFYEKVKQAEANCASIDELEALLGRARAKKGMFEGDMIEGELEIGQVSSMINKIIPAKDIVNELWADYNAILNSYRK